jgi:sec-independent protein translocase protein TatA
MSILPYLDSFANLLATDKFLSQDCKNPYEKGACGGSFGVFALFKATKPAYLCHRRIQHADVRVCHRRENMLNNIGLPGLLLIAVVVLVLFGRGKISSLMGEVGKGITAFKKGVDDGKKEIEDGIAEAKDVTPEEEKDKV